MRTRKAGRWLISNAIIIFTLFFIMTLPVMAADVLPSWHEGRTKQAIIQFVTDVTNKSGPKFIEPAERIAVFDNDGTLWSEKPAYFQLFFALDRLKALAPKHPEWKTK